MNIGLKTFLKYSGNRLPYDAEIEYLESTGTQWIDTGYVPQVPITEKYVLDCIVPPIDSNWQVWFGSGATDAERDIFWRQRQNLINNWQCYVPKSDANYYSYATVSNIVAGMDTRVIVNPNGGYYSFNDLTYNSLGTLRQHVTHSAINNKSVFLFKANNAQTTSRRMKVYRFYVQDYATNEMLLDMIPVRKGNKGYMYDHVSGKLFENKGHGDFVLGPDIIPVEYIESTGTQYIDTGFTANGGMILETKANQIDGQFSIGSIKGGTAATADVSRNMVNFVVNSIDTTSTGYDFEKMNQYGDVNIALRYACAVNDTTPHIMYLNTIGNLLIAKVDGQTLYNGTTSATLVNQSNSVKIGRSDYSGTVRKGRYFYVKLWDSTEALVRDFIPVRVGSGSTWEGAMLDRLTHKVYRNAGTGNFLYG